MEQFAGGACLGFIGGIFFMLILIAFIRNSQISRDEERAGRER